MVPSVFMLTEKKKFELYQDMLVIKLKFAALTILMVPAPMVSVAHSSMIQTILPKDEI